MRIHREGKSILIIVLTVLLVVHWFLFQHYAIGYWPRVVMVSISSSFYLWILYFFRSPVREVTPEDHLILAPADGKILSVEEVMEDEYFKKRRIKISIFMSPFNVHVNRMPISGTIRFFRYHPGKHKVAFHPKSSSQNERTTVVVAHQDNFEVLFRQIAGFMARRIKFYYQQGDIVEQGAECGFIKFGSRADIYLPLNTDIQVTPGDRVKGGISILAEVA